MSSDSDSDTVQSSIKREKRTPSPIRRSLKAKTSHNTSANNSYKEKDDPNASIIREGGFQHRPSIEEYLAKRSTLTIVDSSRKESPLDAEDLLENGDDEEVWLIQCPRDVNIEKLVGVRLNLDGERHKAKKEKVPLEYESEAIQKDRFVTVMCKSRERRPTHRMVSLKPAGLVRVQAKLEEPCDPDIHPVKAPRVPYPSNLKIRHPLHGIDYEKRTELAVDVQSKLQSAVKASNVAKCEVSVKKERPDNVDMEESFNELMGIKEDPSPVKKAKKRKAPKEEPSAVDGDAVDAEDRPRKAKRSKKLKVEEIGDVNLDWLSAI